MRLVMTEDGISHRLAYPQLPRQVGAQLAVAAPIALGKPNIDIMQQSPASSYSSSFYPKRRARARMTASVANICFTSFSLSILTLTESSASLRFIGSPFPAFQRLQEQHQCKGNRRQDSTDGKSQTIAAGDIENVTRHGGTNRRAETADKSS